MRPSAPRGVCYAIAFCGLLPVQLDALVLFRLTILRKLAHRIFTDHHHSQTRTSMLRKLMRLTTNFRTRWCTSCDSPTSQVLQRGRMTTSLRLWSRKNAAKTLMLNIFMFAPSSEAPTGVLALTVIVGLPAALWTYKVVFPRQQIRLSLILLITVHYDDSLSAQHHLHGSVKTTPIH